MKSFVGVYILFFFLFVLPWKGASQSPIAGFSLPASVCLDQNAKANNTSTGAVHYEWDICQGDLGLTPSVGVAGITAGNIPTGIDIVFDGQKWFGFLASRETNSIIRLDFGNDLTSVPVSLDLGNVSGALGRPIDVKIVKDGTEWYGFVYSQGTPSSLISRIKFGNSLENTTTSSSPLSADVVTSGSGGVNAGFDVVNNGANWIIVYTLSSSVGVIRLNNINAIPSTADILTSSPLTGAIGLGDIKVISSNGQWFAYTVAYQSQTVHQLNFGSNLFSAPANSNITGSFIGSLTPYGVEGGFDDGNYYLLISTIEGNLIRINLGNNLLLGPVSGSFLGNFSVMSSTLKIKLFKYKSQWTAFSIAFNTNELFRISFPNPPCSALPSFVETFEPVIRFNTSGQKFVTLRSFDISDNFNEESHSVAVSATQAPAIDFQNQNICAQSPVNFTSQSPQTLSTVSWDFGNGITSTQLSPSVTYSSSGNYAVTLNAAASNGCSNYVEKQITIYNQPIANFTLPSIVPLCTNQSYLLTNTSSFDTGSNPSWEWRLNGTLVSAQQNFAALFNSPVAQEIRLKALIPGCENELIKTVTGLTTGPAVNFLANDNCQGSSVSFTNTTTGIVDAGYAWNFGDVSNSTLTNPVHNYSSPAIYQVILTASNSAGCQNSQKKPIKIYSLPQPNFSIGLPPFSCNNSPTPFQNVTPPLTDSNITAWNWQFGDTAGGTSLQKNPSYSFPVAGTFNVQLSAVSDAGCSVSVTKPVTISLSPTADFTVGPSCLNVSTKFTDLSSGGIQSRVWQIGVSSFGVPNPTNTFTSTGNFNATLNVTSANGCSNVVTKVINVPVPPALNFSVANPCSGKNTLFSDATPSAADGIVGWNWNFAGNSLTGNPAENNFDTQGTYTVKLTTTHASGCKYTLSKNVLINPSPIAGFIASPDRGAPPLTVQFENTSQQAVNYAWKFNDKVFATSTRISPVYTFTSLGDYSAELTATSAQGCSDVKSVPIKVLVPAIDLILKSFSLVNDPVTGKLKASVTILNNSNVPVGSSEIVLFLADKAVVNETVVLNLNPDQSITKTLSFSLSPNQFDFSFLCAEINSEKDFQPDNNKRCINLSNTDYVFGPYPNPTTGTVHVDWISEKSGVTRIIVYDTMGKKSYEWETTSQSGLNQAILDLEFLSTGLYYLTIETSGSKKTTRFLRQ